MTRTRRPAFKATTRHVYWGFRHAVTKRALHALCWLNALRYGLPVDPDVLETHILTGDLRGTYFSMPKSQVGAGYALGIFERHVFSSMRTYVSPGSTAYDVGASWGYHALFFSKLVGPEGSVFTFEPDSRDYGLLCRNIEKNGITNAHPVPTAVARTSGEAKFATFSCPGISHIAREDTASDAEFVTVEMTSLDDFVYEQHHSAPSFIKIDVEGGELEVLGGAARILQEARPVVVCEVRGPTSSMVTDLMRSNGYAPRVLQGSPTLADVLFLPSEA